MWVLRILRVLNVAAALFFLGVLATTFLFEARLLAHLANRHPGVEVAGVLMACRWILLVGLFAVPPAQVLLTAVLRMVRTVEEGDPFVPANARRLQAIGWALLVLQVADMLFGMLAGRVAQYGMQFGTGWSFSLIGWIAVLLVFVLARIFAQGTAMREELEMTI